MTNTNDDNNITSASLSTGAGRRSGRRVSGRALAMMAATVAVVGVSAGAAAAAPDSIDGQNDIAPMPTVEVLPVDGTPLDLGAPINVLDDLTVGTDVNWNDPAVDPADFDDWAGEWGGGDGWDDCPGCGLG